MRIKMTVFMTILLMLLISCNEFQKKQVEQVVTVKDWSSPEKINPLDENVGDFMEMNMREYMIKADSAYWSKDYKLAAQYYLFMLSHNVYDIVSTYNLACTYGLMGKPELSAKFLYKAIDLGFVDFNYIKKDTDFDKVRGTEVFDAAIDSIGTMIKNLGDIILIESKSLLKCRVTKPLAFYPDKKYKLLVGLHSYSSSHDQLIKVWRYFDIPDFIFAVPQAPYGVSIGLANEFRWSIDEIDIPTISRSDKKSVEYVKDVINNLKSSYNVSEIYLLGLYQGSGVAFNLAFNEPGLIDGVIAFGADYDISKVSEEQISKAKGTKFFIANSDIDSTYVDMEMCASLKKTLVEKGFDVKYQELGTESTITEQFKQFMKEAQKRFLKD